MLELGRGDGESEVNFGDHWWPLWQAVGWTVETCEVIAVTGEAESSQLL